MHVLVHACARSRLCTPVRYGILAVAYQAWHTSHGMLAMAMLGYGVPLITYELWHTCYGILVTAYWLWRISHGNDDLDISNRHLACHDIFVMAYLLWHISYGMLVMAY